RRRDRLGDTLQWGPEDSGSNGYYVIYKAVPGESPVISGGVPVTAWSPAADSELWKASVPGMEFRGLRFEHGAWMRPSEEGISTIQGDIIASGLNQTGGQHQGEKIAGNVVVHAAKDIRFERNR